MLWSAWHIWLHCHCKATVYTQLSVTYVWCINLMSSAALCNMYTCTVQQCASKALPPKPGSNFLAACIFSIHCIIKMIIIAIIIIIIALVIRLGILGPDGSAVIWPPRANVAHSLVHLLHLGTLLHYKGCPQVGTLWAKCTKPCPQFCYALLHFATLTPPWRTTTLRLPTLTVSG